MENSWKEIKFYKILYILPNLQCAALNIIIYWYHQFFVPIVLVGLNSVWQFDSYVINNEYCWNLRTEWFFSPNSDSKTLVRTCNKWMKKYSPIL